MTSLLGQKVKAANDAWFATCCSSARSVELVNSNARSTPAHALRIDSWSSKSPWTNLICARALLGPYADHA
jgi:hypothetical protein